MVTIQSGPPLLDELLGILACPEDHSHLRCLDGVLLCEQRHRFPLEQGIPVLTGHARRELSPSNMAPCSQPIPSGPVDPFVNDWVVNTNGNLYWKVRGKLQRYPVPDWPFPAGKGRILVDVGCSWGRWTVAAARADYRPIGIDVHLDALAAGARVCRQLDVRAGFVCCDVERLPFQPASIDVLFSYSVLQHLDRAKVRKALGEFSRVLKAGGACFFQLPNRFGLFSALRQARRGFREAKDGTFEMRYWSRSEIREAVERAGLRTPTFRVDGFLSQNPQLSDIEMLSSFGKVVVRASHAGRQAANRFPPLGWIADSLWIEARAPE